MSSYWTKKEHAHLALEFLYSFNDLGSDRKKQKFAAKCAILLDEEELKA